MKLFSKYTPEEKKAKKQAIDKLYYQKNKEKIKARVKAKFEKNREEKRLVDKLYYEKNKEKVKKKCKQYRDINRSKYVAYSAKYDASKIQATPSWANLKRIECYYSLARMLTLNTGEVWTVDHTVPLRGKNVCGLHTHDNMTVMTKTQNSSKNNRFRQGY